MKSWIMSWIVAAFLLPGAYAGNDAAAAGTPQAAIARSRHGLLYRVNTADNTTTVAYLFGTVHVGIPEFYPLRDAVMQALAQSSRLVVEFDPRDEREFQVAMEHHGLYAQGEDIKHQLPPELAVRLEQALQPFGIPLAQIARFKPWLLLNMLVALNLQRQGYLREYGTEHFLLRTAEQQNKPIVELESAEQQLSLFNTLAGEDQLLYLRENLDELERGVALDKARQLVKAWEQADITAIEAFMTRAVEEKTVSGRFLKQVLLDQRNIKMAETIGELIHGSGTSFVGVGLLHLLGDTGLPTLLKQRGYLVERVE